jgi:hypothetical protein
MNVKKISFVLGLSLSICLGAFAQGPGGSGQARERVRQNLSTLRLIRLTQALDLTEDQTAKIYPTYNKIEADKLKTQRDMAADIRDLRELLREPSPKDADILAKLKDLKEARRLIKTRDDDLESFLENNLTTSQKAKYVLFQIEFYRGMEQIVERGRMMRKNGGQPPVKK